MKKVFTFFAILAVLTLVVSCGGNENDETDQCDLEPYYECRDSDSYYCQPNSSCEYECELFEYCNGCCLEGTCAYDCCYLESYSECRGSDLYYCGVQHPCQYECELECEDCCGS